MPCKYKVIYVIWFYLSREEVRNLNIALNKLTQCNLSKRITNITYSYAIVFFVYKLLSYIKLFEILQLRNS